jgi:hypothetical protein
VKVHPFLAVAVIPFKAVMTLELKRRDNDRRILVLVTQVRPEDSYCSHRLCLIMDSLGAR